MSRTCAKPIPASDASRRTWLPSRRRPTCPVCGDDDTTTITTGAVLYGACDTCGHTWAVSLPEILRAAVSWLPEMGGDLIGAVASAAAGHSTDRDRMLSEPFGVRVVCDAAVDAVHTWICAFDGADLSADWEDSDAVTAAWQRLHPGDAARALASAADMVTGYLVRCPVPVRPGEES